MKNIPMFTTEDGIASLILEEIPYKKCAYIRIHSSTDPEKLLADAIGFCCAVGADNIYATGVQMLEKYPLHTEIWEMMCAKFECRSSNATLIPVDEKTASDWQQLYNRHMTDVPNAATMTAPEAQKLLDTNDGYFVFEDGVCIGIGKAKGDRIEAIISFVPGKGGGILCALCSALSSDTIKVEVASANAKAVRLYEKFGFVKSDVLSKWYKVV